LKIPHHTLNYGCTGFGSAQPSHKSGVFSKSGEIWLWPNLQQDLLDFLTHMFWLLAVEKQ